jgi:signal transduction histidine kinase
VVEATDDLLSAEVSYDSVGGVLEQRGGGLEELRDRVQALGGRLEVAERKGAGTVPRPSIPLGQRVEPLASR